jgi:hypothetical protein
VARPSNIQVGALSLIRGLAEGMGRRREMDEQGARAEALQQALERRQEEKDQRNAIPKSLYAPMWEKMTGLPVPEDAPPYLSPTLGSVFLQYPGKQLAANRAGGGTLTPRERAKMLGDAYSQALQAGRTALGGKRSIAPDYGDLVGPDRETFNQAAANEWAARMRGLGVQEAPPTFLEAVPGKPSEGGFLGIGGTPAQAERSRLSPYNYAPSSPGPVTSAGDRVNKIIQGYRANKGWNDVQISQALSKAGINLSPDQVAQVR